MEAFRLDGTIEPETIDEALVPFGGLPWGVCDIGPDIPLPEKYEKALVVIVPFLRMLSMDDYSEPLFKGLQWETFARIRNISAALSDMFKSRGARFGFPPETESLDIDAFETEMTEIFSAKEAARRAGLGWIGKNNLLVTEKYGPRISILSILCDISLPQGSPAHKNRCGGCRMCAAHCALRVIRGKPWAEGIKREEQIDYAKCSLSRLLGYGSVGRKFTCGKCVAACPYGTEKTEKIDKG